MEARERLDGFHFDDDEILDEKIEPVARIEAKPLIPQRLRNLPANGQASQPQLVDKAGLVDRFQKPGPKRSVNFQTGIDNLPRHDIRRR